MRSLFTRRLSHDDPATDALIQRAYTVSGLMEMLGAGCKHTCYLERDLYELATLLLAMRDAYRAGRLLGGGAP
jgi:hypothetical protein